MFQDASILIAFSFTEKFESMSWLELVLWIGLAMLTVSLLVLMGTRWGQVRPISKCVVLSVFAHILFFCYAYGTSFQFAHGSWGGNPLVKVSFIAPHEDGGDVSDGTKPFPMHDDLDPPPVAADAEVENAVTDSPAPSPQEEAAAKKLSHPATEASATEKSATETRATEAPQPPPLASPPPFPPVSAPPLSQLADTSAHPNNPPALLPTAENPAPTPDTHPNPEENAAPSTPHHAADTAVAADPGADPGGTAEPVVATAPGGSVAASAPPETRDPSASEALAAAESFAAVRSVDGQPLPEPYQMRVAPNRLRLAMPYGASVESESAVAAALTWLAANQHSDGRWDASHFGAGRETKTLGHDRQGAGATADMGITGLALLAFLGGGHTHIEGLYRDTVQHGLQYLMREQHSDGNLAGEAKLFEKMYCHGIATLALGEAFAMTGDSRLQPCLRRAIQYTLAAQDRVTGGWRYQPGDRGDMSQFGWQVMALRSAQLGGMEIPKEARARMILFMNSVAQGQHGGLVSYRSKERVSRTMTAESLACRYFLDEPAHPAMLLEAQDFLLQELPGESEPNLYYWYYATLSLFQTQGAEWTAWNQALQRQLLATQRRDEGLAGSWDTRDVWGGYGGRIYTTAMATLCLEVYYRYLPIFDPDHAVRRAKAEGPGAVRR